MKSNTLTLAGALIACGALFCTSGCGSPSKVNVELRKQNQMLQAQLAELREENRLQLNVIQGLRSRQPSIPTLPSARLSRLFTTHGLEFGRLTGGADLDPNKPGDEGLEIDVVPVDQNGEKLKAAGAFDIAAFDLADPKDPLIGQWKFNVQQSMAAWNGYLLQYNYVFTVRWQKPPRHANVTVKVTFLDELTQLPFTAQKVVQVNLPIRPTTQP